MKHRDGAFTLVEALVWMAMITVLASISSAIVVSLLDTSRAVRRAADNAGDVLPALEQLGADARASRRALSTDRVLKPGEACVILERCSGGRVVYSVEDGVLYRQAERKVPVGRVEGVTFSYRNASESSAGFVELAWKGGHGTGSRHRFYLMAEDRP